MPSGAFPRVLFLLLAAGWSANHFTAVIPVLRQGGDLPHGALEGAFGIYAIGLLPGLIGGGTLSDRVGRRPLVLLGSTMGAAGNLLMLGWHGADGLLAGRFLVGLGVGLAMSAGTAWAADLRGQHGTTVAGVTLTCGFAAGPLVSGLLGQFLPHDAALTVPFAVSVALSATAIGMGALTHAPSGHASQVAAADPAAPDAPLARALMASVPMALWVFASVTVPIVVLVSEMSSRYDGAWLPGVVCVIALGTGVVTQIVARHRGWGTRSGIVGAGLAAVGFTLAALVTHSPSLGTLSLASVVLGVAYGLCLRNGLLDVETLTPPARRGTALGAFYVFTYLGFGLPSLLELLRPRTGLVAPLLALAAVAVVTAGVRARQVRSDAPPRAPAAPPSPRCR